MDVQPVLLIGCEAEGLVHINGRLAGETGPEQPLVAPVTPGTPIYLEFSPYGSLWLPMACRLRLEAGGEPGEDVYLMAWPSGVWEAELMPRRASGPEPSGRELPDYALEPDDARKGQGTLCVGPCRDGGRYAAALDGSGRLRFCARGDESYFTQTGEMRLFLRDTDTVGHARLMTFRTAGDGVELAECEPMWVPGAPHWPDSPEKTAMAAAEAAILGLWDEAEGYLLPERRENLREVLRACGEYQCAAPLPVTPPDGRSAIALCRATGRHTGDARALRYHAVPGGGSQGPWRLDALEIADSLPPPQK